MPRALAFYRDILGFAVKDPEAGDNRGFAELELGDFKLMLNTQYDDHERPPSPDPDRITAHADTALYIWCDDADEVFSHLRTKGWEAREPATARYGMRQVYTQDPDGYVVCFQHAARESA
jgi:catechol 2,3-dioxygenase-like lactoylglutathione lyase family enzyme